MDATRDDHLPGILGPKHAIAEAEILPALARIYAVCAEHDIPFIGMVQVEGETDDTFCLKGAMYVEEEGSAEYPLVTAAAVLSAPQEVHDRALQFRNALMEAARETEGQRLGAAAQAAGSTLPN